MEKGIAVMAVWGRSVVPTNIPREWVSIGIIRDPVLAIEVLWA